MRRTALLLALLLAAPAWAVDEIKGPSEVPVHQFATVTTDVEADGYIWLAFPLETTFAADQASPKVLQFTGTPGAHQVILIPLRDGKPSGQYRKTVTFGDAPVPPPVPPGPGPQPPTPVPPDSGFGLAAIVRTQAAAIPAVERKRGAGLLAAAYGETLKLAREGKFATPQQMLDDAKVRVPAARPPSWSGFTLAAKFNELAKAGKIATSDDVIRAFTEIASSLQEVADAQ